MAILSDPPEWRVPGQKPPQNIIEVLGWEVASHPPAPWFNWFFHRVFESLLELESATLARVVNEAGVPSIMAGPESERPAASQETAGRIYIATDTKRMFRNRGNGWDLLNTPDAIGAETPDGAQQKADAAVAAHANRTDNPHNVQAQQVPYSSGVSGFTPSTVKAALDALAGVRIVEMGTNSNGTYVRWENGFQVCVGSTVYTQSVGGSPWWYPAVFTSPPIVSVSPVVRETNFRAFMPLLAVVETNRATTHIYDAVRTSSLAPSEACNLHWIAVGRWK